MEKVISNIVSELNNGNYIIAAVIVVATIIFNLNAIVNFFDSRKKMKINLISDALDNNNVTGATKIFLENLLEVEYFYKITGVAAEKKIREELIDAYCASQGKIRFSHFKRAVPYTVFKNERISIEIGWFTKVAFAYNMMSAIFNFTGAILLVCFMIVKSEIVMVNFYQSLILLVISIVLGIFFLAQSLPFISSYYVKKHLKEIRQPEGPLRE